MKITYLIIFFLMISVDVSAQKNDELVKNKLSWEDKSSKSLCMGTICMDVKSRKDKDINSKATKFDRMRIKDPNSKDSYNSDGGSSSTIQFNFDKD